MLGTAGKIELTKDTTTIVGDGSTQEAVEKRVAQIRNLIEVCAMAGLWLIYRLMRETIAVA